MVHWVVMRTTISDVPIYACAYDWIQLSISYFLSTTGNINPSNHLNWSQFKDEFVCVGWRYIPRPNSADFIYDFLPLIDEHNKQLQKFRPSRNYGQQKTASFSFLPLFLACVLSIIIICSGTAYPKNANSMVQLKKDQKYHLKWHMDKIWKKFSKEGAYIIKPGWQDRKIEFAGGKKSDHSDNHSFPSSTFLVNNSSVIPRFKP